MEDVENQTQVAPETTPEPQAAPAAPQPDINELVNKAVSARMEREKTKLQAAAEKAAAAKLVASEGIVSAPPDLSVRLAQLEVANKQLADKQAAQEAKEAEIAAKAKALRDQEDMATVSGLLQNKGAMNVAMAMKVLKADARIYRDEAGALKFKGDAGDKDVDAGLADWLGGEEGGMFLPPKAPPGSGFIPAKTAGPVGSDDVEAAKAYLRTQLGRR